MQKILIVHPGASWSTHDVCMGLDYGLRYLGARTNIYKLDVRIARSGRWLRWNWKMGGKVGDPPNPLDVQYHAAVGVLERAFRLAPDWVFVVSGMYFHVDLLRYLKRAGFRVAMLFTESPYDDDAQVEVARLVDVAWTNERTSVERLRTHNPNVYYLPHAYHPLVHGYVKPTDETPSHDALFIGTGFSERIAFLNQVDWGGLEPALYGYWTKLGSRAMLRKAVRGGVVENDAASQLYQRARINLNLHRTSKGVSADDTQTITVAESLNPRVFELAACGAFFLTDPRAELADVFGDLVPTFTSPAELSAQLARWRDDPEGRRRISEACREAVQPHSWLARAETVLRELERRT